MPVPYGTDCQGLAPSHITDTGACTGGWQVLITSEPLTN